MYAKILFGILLKMVDSKELAEDLLQQSFEKIWNSFEIYDNSKGRLFTWMLAITRNLVRDFNSKQDHQNLTNEPLTLNLAYIEQHNTVVFNTDTIGKLRVGKLKQEHKAILNLIYYKGYTHAEVVEELKIPLDTVKTSCRMAMGILRGRLNEPAQDVT